ncbi:MAG: AIR synthase-related protein [bacterium]|nr:AIR synthase-related protein [bacterium]
MTLYRLEVGLKPQMEDPIGNKLAKEFAAHGFGQIKSLRHLEVYLIKNGQIKDRDHLNDLNQKLFLDPVVHQLTPDGLWGDHAPFDWWVEISFKPGVTDNAAHVAKENLNLLLPPFGPGEDVASAKAFLLQGDFTAEQVNAAADQLLLNGLIEKKIVISKAQWEARKGELTYFPEAEVMAQVSTERLDCSSSEAVLKLSEERLLALSAEEAEVIARYYQDPKVQAEREQRGIGATPTDVELECIAQTWSEHCKHKIFNAWIDYRDESGQPQEIKSLYKSFIQASTKEIRRRLGEKDWLLSVFKDNAGVVKFTDDWSLAFKVETHNSPSALDPYGGALTGIVGVNRDSFGTGMGAQLIANTDVFCFGPLDYDQPLPKKLMHPSRIYQGVRLGVEHGGNQSGIPTVNGALVFDDTFVGKPLVFCGTLSVMPAQHEGRPSEEKKARPGDHILMVGGRIGKDGIHGATFSSLALEETSPVSAVQIGDPITQKRMFDFLWRAKAENLFSCITDNGAGGLSSSIGEMSEDSGGCRLHLDRAPLKYAGLQPWEILISEAQERMTLAVPPEKVARFLELSNEMLVESSDLGEFTDSGYLECFYEGQLVASLSMEFLHDGLPPMKIKAQWQAPNESHPDFAEPEDLGQMLAQVLARPNVCSKEKVVRQYDHEVGGASAIKPMGGAANDGPNDGGVLRPVLGLDQAVALSNGICPKYSAIDTYHMAANAIDESIRNLVAVGANPDRIAGLDNFCWPDPVQSAKTPDGEFKAAQLVRACQAIYDYCLAYGVPCISGKDSMKNDANLDGKKISILPTLLFSALGVVDSLSDCATHDLKQAGDRVYLLGTTQRELGGSEYMAQLGLTGGLVPKVDAASAMARYRSLHQALTQGLVASVHDCSDGGLAVALAEKAIGGRLGLALDLGPLLAASNLRPDELLFSESASRLVVSVAPEQTAAFEALFAGQACTFLGEVTQEPNLAFKNGNEKLLQASIYALKDSWQSYLERF